MIATASTPATAGPLRDIPAAINGIGRETERFLNASDSLIAKGDGDAFFWRARAEEMAFQAAAYAARSTLAVASQREDSPAVRSGNIERMRDADEAFRGEADRTIAGQGDAAFWRERCRRLSLRAALHAATAASLCDGALAGLVQTKIERGLMQAHTAFEGEGNAQAWASQAGQLRDQLKASVGTSSGTAPRPPMQRGYPPMPGLVQEDLTRLNQQLSRDLEVLMAKPVQGPATWLQRTEEIALRAAAHGTRQSLLVARQHELSAQDRVTAADRVRGMAADLTRVVDGATAGEHDEAAWRRQTGVLAVQAAECLPVIASRCDAPLADAVAPLLEVVQARSEQAVSAPPSKSSARSQMVDFAEDLRVRLDRLQIGARAEAAALAVPAAGSTEERQAAEVDFARAAVVRDGWTGALTARETRLAAVHTSMYSLVDRVNKLVDRSTRVVPMWGRGAWGLIIGSTAGLIGGVSLGFSGPLGIGLTIGGLVAGVAGFCVHTWAQREYVRIRREYDTIMVRANQLQYDEKALDDVMKDVRARKDGAEREAHDLQGKLEVMRMADAVNAPPPPRDATVDVGGDTVDIGGLKLPRRPQPPAR